jgi:phosphatidylserine decarboxylase
VQSLLQDDELAKQFQGCSIGVFRLAPQDYHRYHIPVDGVLGPTTFINGLFS